MYTSLNTETGNTNLAFRYELAEGDPGRQSAFGFDLLGMEMLTRSHVIILIVIHTQDFTMWEVKKNHSTVKGKS
ncbi:MAG: hypothetical protein IPO48_19950 [Saprospiraceae bacterium]|nr:hypothetical protein [Saprospiraceae bacterium]